jgi:hypothetical protein
VGGRPCQVGRLAGASCCCCLAGCRVVAPETLPCRAAGPRCATLRCTARIVGMGPPGLAAAAGGRMPCNAAPPPPFPDPNPSFFSRRSLVPVGCEAAVCSLCREEEPAAVRCRFLASGSITCTGRQVGGDVMDEHRHGSQGQASNTSAARPNTI